jgi:quercetin dioxygenase-like cupin family protein
MATALVASAAGCELRVSATGIHRDMPIPQPWRFLSLCSCALAFAPFVQAEGTSAPLSSRVFTWESLQAKTTPVGQRRDVADQPTKTLERFESHVSTLRPGMMSHPPHRHPQEEFIILKEGTLEVNANGKPQTVGPGSLFFFASNDLHNVRNVGDGAATYLVFNLATAATRSAPADGAEKSARPGVMGSATFDWKKLAVVKTAKGERRELFNTPTTTCKNLECHVTTLRAGEVPHAPHRHSDEEIIVVKEGTMEVTVNGVATRAGPGSICFFASNDEHGMKNVGESVASYYVIRVVTELTPKP